MCGSDLRVYGVDLPLRFGDLRVEFVAFDDGGELIVDVTVLCSNGLFEFCAQCVVGLIFGFGGFEAGGEFRVFVAELLAEFFLVFNVCDGLCAVGFIEVFDVDFFSDILRVVDVAFTVFLFIDDIALSRCAADNCCVDDDERFTGRAVFEDLQVLCAAFLGQFVP